VIGLSPALVQEILDELGLKHFIDSDGDVGTMWDGFRVYFFLHGERKEILQARAYLDGRFALDEKPALLDRLDEWNRTRLGPKAYSAVDDDGGVRVMAEHTLDTEPGVSREMLVFTMRAWVVSIVRFVGWFTGKA
jgi:hypothetical protein